MVVTISTWDLQGSARPDIDAVVRRLRPEDDQILDATVPTAAESDLAAYRQLSVAFGTDGERQQRS